MNKDTIKEKAEIGGYTIDSETDTKIVFIKDNKTVTVNAAENIIITTISGKNAYNFVSEENIDSVAKFLLKQ